MSKIVIKSEKAPAPIGPYSQAIQAGNTLYVSGQVAFDPQTGQLENENITTETRQVLRNITAVLDAAGFVWSDVVKTSIFLQDLNDFNTVNTIYGELFQQNPPARETVQVARLPRDARVEISVIAVK